MKADWTRILGWAIPLVCMAIAAIAVYSQYSRLQGANERLRAAQRQESLVAAQKIQAERSKGTYREIAAPDKPTEEPKFLNGLRSKAATYGVLLSKWTSRRLPAASPSGDPKDTNATQLSGIVKISCDLTIVGPYQNVRSFLTSLANSNRLYTMSNVQWTRKPPKTEATLTITRYVDTTQTAATTAQGNVNKAP